MLLKKVFGAAGGLRWPGGMPVYGPKGLPPTNPPKQRRNGRFARVGALSLTNDPSAGSPTETLLRLLLPLNDRVWVTFRPGVAVSRLSGPVRKPH